MYFGNFFFFTMCLFYFKKEKKKVTKVYYQRSREDYQKKMFNSYFCRARLGLGRAGEVTVAVYHCLFRTVCFSTICIYYFDNFLYY